MTNYLNRTYSKCVIKRHVDRPRHESRQASLASKRGRVQRCPLPGRRPSRPIFPTFDEIPGDEIPDTGDVHCVHSQQSGVKSNCEPRREYENDRGPVGLPNQRSLDDTAEITGPTRDLFTDPGRSRTHMNAVNTFPLNQWTIELSVKPFGLGRVQTLLGEDGKPTAHPHAPLQIQIRQDNRIAVVAIDASGTVRSVASIAPVSRGQWYHVAALSDGRTLKLLLNRGRGYDEQDATDFTGPLISNAGTWTIGRGFHNGKLAFDARALVDEIRVSAVSLPARLLLWSGELRPWWRRADSKAADVAACAAGCKKGWEYQTSWPPASEGEVLHPLQFACRGRLRGR